MADACGTPAGKVRRRASSPSPIHERKATRKLRRRSSGPLGCSVIEGIKPSADASGEPDAFLDTAEAKRQGSYGRLAAFSKRSAQDNLDDAIENLPAGFAADYFTAPVCTKPGRAAALCAAVTSMLPASGSEPLAIAAEPVSSRERWERWLQRLQRGFSVLVNGVGSKRKLLEAFADESLVPWGATVVRVEGHSTRFSLLECLRDVLDVVYPTAPKGGTSGEGLASAICNARKLASAPVRPLCFVVHNIEGIPQAQQAVLASLAAAPGVHLVASVDNIWAPLTWSPRMLKDFNFSRQEEHTYEGFRTDVANRYAEVLPAWCDPLADRRRTPKASLALVLRSLTQSHKELVQSIAQHQLDNGGRAGISTSKLLVIASDRMIAGTMTKLRSLMNELQDHEVVAQRGASDGSTVFHLCCDAQTLQRLADGLSPADSDDSGEESGLE